MWTRRDILSLVGSAFALLALIAIIGFAALCTIYRFRYPEKTQTQLIIDNVKMEPVRDLFRGVAAEEKITYQNQL